MDESTAFFRATEQGLAPLRLASSAWAENMINGPAICSVVARALENEHTAPGFAPTRLTVDLFSPVAFTTLRITTALIRAGNRIRVADATVTQNGKPVARATAVFLKQSAQPDGVRWTREQPPEPPPAGLTMPGTRHALPLWASDAHPGGWSTAAADHQNANRKRSWHRPLDAVLGEVSSPFVQAATTGEAASMMTNWGTAGVGFINADLTLALARAPIGNDIGLEADNHLSYDGIAVGTATLFDRHGSFGTAMVTAVSNGRRQIDLADTELLRATLGRN